MERLECVSSTVVGICAYINDFVLFFLDERLKQTITIMRNELLVLPYIVCM